MMLGLGLKQLLGGVLSKNAASIIAAGALYHTSSIVQKSLKSRSADYWWKSDVQTQPRILVTGAGGQVGLELVPFLQHQVGVKNVVASDIRANEELSAMGQFYYCDVTDQANLARLIVENQITHVVHLATLLSAIGEQNPALALRVNTIGIQNILDLAVRHKFQVFAPSTIAAFGDGTPKILTPDVTITNPSTMYGITKVHQELLGAYYVQKYGVDFRSLRYPGIISAKAMPGGGTTDYAVEIFHEAIRHGRYQCYLSMNTGLPMMYMPDCIQATWQLMMAPKSCLELSTYNVTAMSFTPMDLAFEIKKRIPHFQIFFAEDYRDDIARTWPTSIDDSRARKDWGWEPMYDLTTMTGDMIEQIVRYIKEQDNRAEKETIPVA